MHKSNAAFFRCRRWFLGPDNHVIGHHRDASTPRWLDLLATHTLTPTTKCYLPFCASSSPRKLNVLAKHFRSHVRDYRSRGTRNKCSQALQRVTFPPPGHRHTLIGCCCGTEWPCVSGNVPPSFCLLHSTSYKWRYVDMSTDGTFQNSLLHVCISFTYLLICN